MGNTCFDMRVLRKWQCIVSKKLDVDLRCAGREARNRCAVLRTEKANAEWAHQQVVGTMKALQVRRACESFGVLFQHAVADNSTTCEDFKHFDQLQDTNFDRLLVNDISSAHAEENETEWWENEGSRYEIDYEDELNTGSNNHRRAAHGARRHVFETVWTSSSRRSNNVKAPLGN